MRTLPACPGDHVIKNRDFRVGVLPSLRWGWFLWVLGSFTLMPYRSFSDKPFSHSRGFSRIWNLEVCASHDLNHQEELCLFFLPSSFFVFSSSHCGSRLSQRPALMSESIVLDLSQCFLFCFYWLDHIQLWSLTNQKFLFFWLIHFLYQEISGWTITLLGLILIWFSVFFSSDL